ncbi:Rid family hydrolase [Labrys wisconsinensis]|uniref:Enamine deaminase RidA (YjgF/YER057c/UK114 family) n=1 Tax=Labrys wisconsinensis TaxID=425677 RepID=A0ABU0JCQ5_9HYPH|nr:Rid family hydrolase [Labrys wisconsinensis]MDQ0471029.1 enamine deaminase RidA (YjgF/YER057c/UK114 family) [Labrys wisconsinensis]
MSSEWPVLRSPGVAPGRSSGSAFGGLACAVATSDDKSLNLDGQARRCFAKIDRVLNDLGTDKRFLLSVTVYLSNIGDKDVFEAAWRDWVGDDSRFWPQRACIGAALSPGTLVELSVTAGRPA